MLLIMLSGEEAVYGENLSDEIFLNVAFDLIKSAYPHKFNQKPRLIRLI